MNPKRKGEVAEAKAVSKLMDMGYGVSVPFGENESYDLIVDKGGELVRAQVKLGRERNGTIRFTAQRTRSNSGGAENVPYKDTEIDVFIVVYDGALYEIPVEETPKSGMYLRITGPDNNQTHNINFAEDYLMGV